MAKYHSKDASRPVPLDFSYNVHRRDLRYKLLDCLLKWFVLAAVGTAVGALLGFIGVGG